MSRRYYSSAAASTTLTSSVGPSDSSITVGSITGLPIQFPWTLILDPGTASEELIEVTAGSGTTLTVTRGVDGTTALAHTSGAVVQHGVSARDFDEPNEHVNATANVHGVTGPLGIPAGVVFEYGGSAAPTGWLLCNGAAVSRSTYANLFDVIGETHGVGDGSTTFNLPDRRDRVAVGVSATKIRGATGGSADAVVVSHAHSHAHGASTGTESADHSHSGTTAAENAAHAHSLPIHDRFVNSGTGATVQEWGAAGQTSGTENANHAHAFSTGGRSATHTHAVTVNTDATSSGVSGTGANLPPYVAMNFIIKT